MVRADCESSVFTMGPKSLWSFQGNTPFEGMIMKGFGANKSSALSNKHVYS